MTPATNDGWNAGSTYEDFMGRWSRPLADVFVRWMDPPPGGHWLDVGTGTGALTSAICRLAEPRSVVACDPSAPFIDSARSRLTDPRVRFEITGVGALPSRAGGYDAAASALALNFFPDPAGAIEEQLGLLRSGGRIGACVWDYAEGMEPLRHFWDAAAAVHPPAADLDEGKRFPICSPESLRSTFEDAVAAHVRVEAISVPTVLSGFEDYWQPLLGGTGPAPALVATLSDRRRDDLRASLSERLGARDGEPIRLTARAWAVEGRRPS